MVHWVFGILTILSAVIIAIAGLLIPKYDKKPTYDVVLNLFEKEKRKSVGKELFADREITVVPYNDGQIDKVKATKNVAFEIGFRRKWSYIILGSGICLLIISLFV
ncbi:MAG: hypothetical protein KGI28_07470 [Thaumarchaeota archaeon]|nr:hypothetical protein [Nitrososphaerota archaeon]